MSERCNCGSFWMAWSFILATFIATLILCLKASGEIQREDNTKCAAAIRAKESERVLLLICAPKAEEAK